ncbi:MAG: hypothetical protein ACXVHM_06220 [Methanobacterium sp.]
MKNELVIITIIFLISTIFGCTNNNQTQYNSKVYGSTYVNFQIPDGWEVHPMPGDGTVIWKKGDPRIRVLELKDKQKFDLEYNNALQEDNATYTIKSGSKIINGIETKFIKTMQNNEGDIQDEYFFTKNNKYYHLEGWAFTGWSGDKQTSARKSIDNAVDTIVNTIK